ncbi:hypothetical protein ZWY2020_006406 [Hordeum vulgare]|nr:hypothetical protein ZWY2020_006406 [Hordeum vulgare]
MCKMSSLDLALPLPPSPPAALRASASPPLVSASVHGVRCPAGIPVRCSIRYGSGAPGRPDQVGGGCVEVELLAPTLPVVFAAMLAADALASRKADPAIGGWMAGAGSTPAPLARVFFGRLSTSPMSTPSSLLGPGQTDPSSTEYYGHRRPAHGLQCSTSVNTG